ncbi:BnaCnng35360D [Brassica napus]|uniref:BnaCnng35360D protein n=1 Tax=Brassica napus TaxID=3708 RepID=A0A078J214_BRANA|nr:BnaCnng35360D [Brassica napus]
MGLESCFRSLWAVFRLETNQTSARARSLRSDRAGRALALGRYVATELWLELGRYAATEWVGRISGNAQPTIFNRETVRDQRGEVVWEIEFVAHSVDPAEANTHWVALCNVEEPPPEPWVPVRPFRKGSSGDRASVPFHSLEPYTASVTFRKTWIFDYPSRGRGLTNLPKAFLLCTRSI